MNSYLKNVLRGFIGEKNYVELSSAVRSTPEFMLVDIDTDDMPEIIVSFRHTGEDYIGILKRKEGTWILQEVRLDDKDEKAAIKSLVKTLENDKLSIENIGEAFVLEDVTEEQESRFISIINNDVYYGCIKVYDRQEEIAPEVIQFSQGDVIGKGTADNIYLLGTRPYGEAGGLVRDIKIVVGSGLTGTTTEIPIKTRNGYYPSIIVEDFTGDRGRDILVTIYTGRVGEFVHTYLYTFENNQPKLIFDSNEFNQTSTGLVEYLDDYRVRVTTLNPPKQYMLDVSEKKDEYMTTIYNEDGSLVESNTFGEILGLVSLNPVDYDRNGTYSLEAVQRIIGTNVRDNVGLLDTLGLLETLLVWDRAAGNFGALNQYVNIYGEPIEPQVAAETILATQPSQPAQQMGSSSTPQVNTGMTNR